MSWELERARREIAEEMHELYEHFAAENGWETNSECHVSFDFLPAANQHVILRMADYVLERERLVREDERRLTVEACAQKGGWAAKKSVCQMPKPTQEQMDAGYVGTTAAEAVERAIRALLPEPRTVKDKHEL